jgi:hypothetical protein
MKAIGTFDVKLSSLDFDLNGKNGLTLERMAINKIFLGDLEATSQGEMLSAITTTQGSAGYVAMEQVSGTLGGKSGSFVLQHFGILNKGRDRLVLEVVPDSASGELVGLTGSMTIDAREGQHHYEFDYEII